LKKGKGFPHGTQKRPKGQETHTLHNLKASHHDLHPKEKPSTWTVSAKEEKKRREEAKRKHASAKIVRFGRRRNLSQLFCEMFVRGEMPHSTSYPSLPKKARGGERKE